MNIRHAMKVSQLKTFSISVASWENLKPRDRIIRAIEVKARNWKGKWEKWGRRHGRK